MSMDTRPADDMAPALYWPSECFVCGRPTKIPGYCSELHKTVVEGEKKEPK